MATCTLQIGDRVVLTSVDGAPEVEYALFDPGEIELVSTGPGMVQEVGYDTSAEDAAARLADAGVTLDLALATSAAMHPSIAIEYARGPAARRVATFLGPAELFDGYEFDAKAKQYAGYWIDISALGADSEIPQLAHLGQACHLTALLHEVPPSTRVHLTTREHMNMARPGGRSHRRFSLRATASLPEALRAFAKRLRERTRVDRPVGPTREELSLVLRTRARASPEPDVQDRLRALETALEIRQHPLRGPLADPQLWAIDEQLSAGRPDGISDLLDTLEKTSGKGPGMVYLRARAALLSGRDPPELIAERAASLALSMPSFLELELLAAEAWNAAGQPRRALPFSRDLISNTTLNDELRVRASQQFPAVVPPAPPSPGEARRAATLPRLPATRPDPGPRDRLTVKTPAATWIPGSPAAAPMYAPAEPGFPKNEASSGDDAETVAAAPPAEDSTLTSAGMLTRFITPRGTAEVRPIVVPPPVPVAGGSRKETPPMVFEVGEPTILAPIKSNTSAEAPPSRPPSNRSEGMLSRRASTWNGPPPAPQSRPPRSATMHFGAALAPPSTPPPPEPAEGVPNPSVAPSSPRSPKQRESEGPSIASMPTPPNTRVSTRPPMDPPRLANWAVTELMRGASQPPFRSDSPHAHLHVPKAPPAPHFGDEAEAAAALALPEGLHGIPASIETLPRSVLDARVQFTFLSRELGREYDEQLGIILRADSGGIEAMQRVLLDRYAKRSITSVEAAADVRRHGAFLSEILARTFGAFWVDIAPSDVGYWAMVVPPSTRVWPFGRILRLIAMQHNERDLVSYFLELQAKAR